MEETFLRFDFVFSNWIFLWFALHIAGLVKASPKFIIDMAGIAIVGCMLYFIYSGVTRYKIVKFLVMNVLLKGIPLYLLRNETITMNDIMYSILLLIAYVGWLHLNGETITGIYAQLNNAYFSNKPDSKRQYISYLYDDIFMEKTIQKN